MKALVILLALALSGCAYWDGMSAEQQQLVIGTVVVGLLVGYHTNDGDTVVTTSPMPVPMRCKHPKYC